MKLAVAQLCSTPQIAQNLQTCLRLISRAAGEGAAAVFFPEASDFIAESKTSAVQLAQHLDGEFVMQIRNAAKDYQVYVSVGVHERFNSDKFFNSHLCKVILTSN
jgi:predicted amidohydrolase